MRRFVATVLGGVLFALPGAAFALGSPVPAPHATALFRLDDPRLDEISGIGAGIRSPDVLYMQNDSGDAARFFALDAHTGRVLADYRVPGASNDDWEDLAVAPDAAGTPSVWLADIGDNQETRTQIEIYRVDEPVVDTGRSDVTATTAPPQVWRLRYPDGAHNAESLAVSPHGRAYLVTKSPAGVSEVFAVPARPGDAVRTVRRIGTVRFSPTGTPGPYPLFGSLTATGAAISADGRRLVVRTYSDAYVWPVRGGDVAAALRGTPVRIPLPPQPQGEGICFHHGALMIDSEHVGSTVYRVRLPEALPRSPSRASPSTPPEPSASVPHARTRRNIGAGSGIGPAGWGTVVGVGTALLVGAGLLLIVRRRRGAHR